MWIHAAVSMWACHSFLEATWPGPIIPTFGRFFRPSEIHAHNSQSIYFWTPRNWFSCRLPRWSLGFHQKLLANSLESPIQPWVRTKESLFLGQQLRYYRPQTNKEFIWLRALIFPNFWRKCIPKTSNFSQMESETCDLSLLPAIYWEKNSTRSIDSFRSLAKILIVQCELFFSRIFSLLRWWFASNPAWLQHFAYLPRPSSLCRKKTRLPHVIFPRSSKKHFSLSVA